MRASSLPHPVHVCRAVSLAVHSFLCSEPNGRVTTRLNPARLPGTQIVGTWADSTLTAAERVEAETNVCIYRAGCSDVGWECLELIERWYRQHAGPLNRCAQPGHSLQYVSFAMDQS